MYASTVTPASKGLGIAAISAATFSAPARNGGILEEAVERSSDRLRRHLVRPQYDRRSRLLAPGRVVELIRAARDEEEWQAVGERAERRPRAAVGHDGSTVRQHVGLRDEPLDADVRRHPAERGRIDVPSGRHEGRRDIVEAVEDRTRARTPPDPLRSRT